MFISTMAALRSPVICCTGIGAMGGDAVDTSTVSA